MADFVGFHDAIVFCVCFLPNEKLNLWVFWHDKKCYNFSIGSREKDCELLDHKF